MVLAAEVATASVQEAHMTAAAMTVAEATAVSVLEVHVAEAPSVWRVYVAVAMMAETPSVGVDCTAEEAATGSSKSLVRFSPAQHYPPLPSSL